MALSPIENLEFRPKKLVAEGVSVFLDFCLLDTYHKPLLLGYFERAKAKVKSISCSLGRKQIRVEWNKYSTRDTEYKTVYKLINMGRDRFVYAVSWNASIGKDYIVTTLEEQADDLFEFLMTRGKLPLLPEWKRYLFTALSEKKYLYKINNGYVNMVDKERMFPLKGKAVPLGQLLVYNVEDITNEVISSIVTQGLQARDIQICQEPMKPLCFTNFDSYIKNYGPSMVAKLEESIRPLAPLKATVDSVAFHKKSFYPQQAACVNGILALKKAGSRYGLMIEGMGCGKTLQGAGVVDAYFNQKWLDQHPGKGLRDLYETGEVSYRAIVMAPSHLVEKWKEEILAEIPMAKVEVLDSFSKLVDLRASGKKRSGREWYLISKDTCKLDTTFSPTPNQTAWLTPKVDFCADCYESKKLFVPKRGYGNRAKCPNCRGSSFFKKQTSSSKQYGLLCPDCGELLMCYSAKLGIEEDANIALTPKDFAGRTTQNSVCYHCGAQLWGVNAKPVNNGLGDWAQHAFNQTPKWYKISHWKNHAKKSKKTAFVLRGKEKSYLQANSIKEYEVSTREFGPRKYAPALYIKKYLKEYFDFCLLDEAHKYESGGSAQSNAAHSLMKASSFTLALSGTISNGKADSFFHLFYMLDPGRMKKMGYDYQDVTRFAQKYGTIESVYENTGTSGVYNSSSRGRQLQSPRVKPGISPLLFSDFLLDKSVFLDLSDLSSFIPSLKETVELVYMPDEVSVHYNATLERLKDAIYSKEGIGMLSNILQFGLSYPDKPYGREPIVSAYVEDCVVASIENFPEYESLEALLPKEKRLIEIINDEIAEGRNCFIYASYTGKGETNITFRLKELVEKECNLAGRVQIISSTSPKPVDREAWLKEKAAEGIKVFICNPKVVETGLDFCFWHKGKFFNYPTIVFYQMSYELAVVWQASRRHFRLSQTAPCRTYYLAYENTLQAAAVHLMAEKQVAASAIQGKFSVEGLTAMAKGVDPRIALAQKLSTGDTSSKSVLANMFDALNEANQGDKEDAYGEWIKPLTYNEVMGILDDVHTPDTDFIGITFLEDFLAETKKESAAEDSLGEKEEYQGLPLPGNIFLEGIPQELVLSTEEVKKSSTRRKSKQVMEGQTSLFDFMYA